MGIEGLGNVNRQPIQPVEKSPIEGVKSLRVIPAEPEVTSLVNSKEGSSHTVTIQSVKVSGQQ